MGDRRAICLICRARQSFQAAASRGVLASGSTGSSRSSSWTPARARWNSTATGEGADATGAAGGENGTGSSSTAEAGTGTRPLRPLFTPEMRRRPNKRSNDIALAVFQDIVDGSRQQGEDQPRAPRRQQQQNAGPNQNQHPGMAGGRGREGQENNSSSSSSDWAELEQIARQQHQHGHLEAEQSSQGRVLPVDEAVYDNLIKLMQMGSQPDTPVTEVFAFFETALYPHLVEAADRLPSIFRQTAKKMMHDVTAAKQRDLLNPDLPSIARITEMRRQLGLLSTPSTWLAMILELAKKILLSEQPSQSDAHQEPAAADGSTPSTEAPLTAAQRERLVDELIDAWRIFILPDTVIANPATLAAAHPTEFRMPVPDAFLLAKYAKEGTPELAIASLFPRYAPQQLQPHALPAVLATYAIVADATVATAAAQHKAHEFTGSVQRMLRVLSLDRRTVARIFGEHAGLARRMVARWAFGGSGSGSSSERSSSSTMDTATAQKRERFAASLKKIHWKVGHALRTRNLQVCDEAWEQFWAAISSPDYQGVVRMQQGDSLFDYFIMVYTTLRMPERAIAVWNLMATVGVQPTLRTWTSFMEGCKLSSNPQGIHSIWEKLMASGMEVDTAAWTARISGLFHAGDVEAGIQALKEMQSTWEAWVADPKKASNNKKAVKVTIEPVNAAVAGVLRAGDMQAARKVLAWAGRHGIEPNVATFNTILRPLVRDGRADEAAGLLEMMRQRGIEPDEATVTILLDGTLGSGALVGRSAAEQTEMVKQVLAEVEAAGLDANQMTYGKIIYLLLEAGIQTSEHKVAYGSRNPGSHHHHSSHGQRRDGDGDGDTDGHDGLSANDRADEAVHVVLDRMRTRNIPLSAHIYTILAEHYFALNPPDVEAVKQLIETGQPMRARAVEEQQQTPPRPVNIPPGGNLKNRFDRVFWERVVRGFAQIGDTQSALKYFKHIEDSLSLTSSTLEDLLQALLKNDDWDAATQLVTKVRAQKMHVVQSGEAARGRGGADPPRMFRHRFWHLAAQHGLL